MASGTEIPSNFDFFIVKSRDTILPLWITWLVISNVKPACKTFKGDNTYSRLTNSSQFKLKSRDKANGSDMIIFYHRVRAGGIKADKVFDFANFRVLIISINYFRFFIIIFPKMRY